MRARATHAVLRAARSEFELCRFRCLTNSGSVLHQNSYRARNIHCFGPARPPLERGMSVNPDAIDHAALLASHNGDVADPYVGAPGAALVFPCATDTCAVPDQNVEKIELDRAAATPARSEAVLDGQTHRAAAAAAPR